MHNQSSAVSIPRGSHHHSRLRFGQARRLKRKFQSLAGVIITHACTSSMWKFITTVSIPRGSHHHSRVDANNRASDCGQFQSLAGVIITHARNVARRNQALFEFQSLAGVIITHAFAGAQPERGEIGFNPSRESSSLTRMWRIGNMSLQRLFQSLAGVIITHAPPLASAIVAPLHE